MAILPTLEAVANGDTVRVEDVTGRDGVAIRLLEMGLTPGVEFELLGIAPLGDPMEIAIRGYRLSLRKSEAARVTIERMA